MRPILTILALATAPLWALPTPADAASGGPDAGGYWFLDSNEPDGPAFNWIELSGLGSSLGLGDDDETEIPIGFPFPFYGSVYDTMTVQSNGGITFVYNYLTLSNDCLPTSLFEQLIVPFWTDMYPPGGAVYSHVSGVEPNRVHTIQWSCPMCCPNGYFEYQVLLFEGSGTIRFQYQQILDNPGTDATIGVQGNMTDAFLQYGCNTSVLTNDLAIDFFTCSAADLDGDGYSECDDDCNDQDASLTPGDQDNDGFSSCEGDCDDLDAFASPDGTEVCDGVDNDCNGQIDDGLDYDYDGYSACNGEDCDDFNSGVYPGAPEIPYDNIDQDCNGSDLNDADGDGHLGGPFGTDCDDLNADIFPGNSEICDNGIDDDCDGIPDQFDDECASEEDGDYSSGCSCTQAGSAASAALLALLLPALLLRRRSP